MPSSSFFFGSIFTLTQAAAKELLENKLLHYFGVTADTATYDQFYRAIAMILKEIMAQDRADFNARADKAGVKVGDRLILLDGKELTQDEFVEAIRAKNVGDTIVLTVQRLDETIDITVVVGDMNQMRR